MKTINYVEVFKALSDDTRINVIKILSKENKCACQILEAFNISQSTLSHHMKLLTGSGLVLASKEGKWVHYKINEPLFNEVKSFFDNIEVVDITCSKCSN